MQNTALIRTVDGRLAWIPPGSGATSLWLDDEQVLRQVQSYVAQRQLEICFAVPGADVRLLPLSITLQEKKHIAQSLPFMLEEQVAQDIENLHVAAVQLDKLTLGVGLCDVEKMQHWSEQLSDVGTLQAWVPEPLLLPWQAGEWCVVVEAETAIVRCGQCSGFSIETELLSALLSASLSTLTEPEAVIVYGLDQEADLTLLPPVIVERVQWRRGGLSEALMLTTTATNSLNMLQGEYAPQLPVRRWWQQWQSVAAVLAVAFGLQLAATYTEYYQLKQENLQLRQAVEQTYRSAFPKGVLNDPEKQLRRQLDLLRGDTSSSGFVALMSEVGQVIASQSGTDIVGVNYTDRGNEMRLNIVATNFETVEIIREGLNTAGLDAIMESSSAQGDGVRARLRVGGGS